MFEDSSVSEAQRQLHTHAFLIQSRSSWTLYACSCFTLQPCSEKPFKRSLYSGCSGAAVNLVELVKTSSCVLNFRSHSTVIKP